MNNHYTKPSSPFCTGSLHLGHIRSYTLSDVHSRWRRKQGDNVLFSFGVDSLGLPTEIAAQERDLPVEEWILKCTGNMISQMKAMNWSIDYERMFLTSSEIMMHWSQYLFLLLHEAGMIVRENLTIDYCNTCRTVLSKLQSKDGCWRCHNETVKKELPSWYLDLRRYADENKKNLDHLPWDKSLKNHQENLADILGYYPISRQRKFGTPIPMIDCSKCGWVPVTFDQLPVKAGSVAYCNCGGKAELDTDVLDTHFDSTIKYVPAAVPLEDREDLPLGSPELQKWLPAAQLIGGRDIGPFIYTQRSVAKALRDIGPFEWLEDGEPFGKVLLHGMVLAEDGQKMSKHLGNAIDPMELIEAHGADVIRVAIINAGSSEKDVRWNKGLIKFAKKFLGNLKDSCERATFSEPANTELLDKQVERIEWAYDHLQFNYVVKNIETLLKENGDSLEVVNTIIEYLDPIAPETCEQMRKVINDRLYRPTDVTELCD